MSGTNPLGDDEFSFSDLNQLFASLSGAMGQSDPWESAAQIANSVASEGGSDPNLDPMDRMAVEDLARVAELHVRQVQGLTLKEQTKVRAVSRTEWTKASLQSFRPFFERFGDAIGQANMGIIQTEAAGDPMAMMFGQMFQAMGPMMVAASAGSMIGHLGQHALGQYDLPIPRTGNDVLVVPGAIDEAAKDWDLNVDELRLWVLVHELTAHAVLSTPHVGRQLDSLLVDFASGFRPDPQKIQEELGDITDLSQLAGMSETLNDPEVVLSMMRSPAQDLIIPQLDALVAAILGYVEHTVAAVCSNLVKNPSAIQDKLRARTVDASPADRFMEQLLGINVTEHTLDRGKSFISGVIERSGDEGLARLWADELDLPTAAEVDAPGLWLARIGLDPDLPGGTVLEVPDDLSGLDD